MCILEAQYYPYIKLIFKLSKSKDRYQLKTDDFNFFYNRGWYFQVINYL